MSIYIESQYFLVLPININRRKHLYKQYDTLQKVNFNYIFAT